MHSLHVHSLHMHSLHANAGAVSPRPFRHERRDQAMWSSCSCERLFIGLGRAADDTRTLPHRRCTREPIRKTYDDTCDMYIVTTVTCDNLRQPTRTHTRAAAEQTGRRDPSAAPRRLAARASQRAVAHLAPHGELRPTRAAAEQTGRRDPTAAPRRLAARASGEKRWLFTVPRSTRAEAHTPRLTPL